MNLMGTTIDAEIIVQMITESSDSTASAAEFTAMSPGSPSASISVESLATAARNVVISFLINQAPTAELTEPMAGERVMEGYSIQAAVQVGDDIDSAENIIISWKVYDVSGNAVLQSGNELMFNITDLTAGFYVIEVTATDSYGLSSSDSVDIEYTLLDTDRDWLSTCQSDTWFDSTLGRTCGPDIYDLDDDNDGFTDVKDAFPLDVCAYLDTDGDTQPDDLNCPEGVSTWLIWTMMAMVFLTALKGLKQIQATITSTPSWSLLHCFSLQYCCSSPDSEKAVQANLHPLTKPTFEEWSG